MKFEHQHDKDSPKITVELPSSSTMEEVVDAFKRFLYQCGYSQENIDEWIPECK